MTGPNSGSPGSAATDHGAGLGKPWESRLREAEPSKRAGAVDPQPSVPAKQIEWSEKLRHEIREVWSASIGRDGTVPAVGLRQALFMCHHFNSRTGAFWQSNENFARTKLLGKKGAKRRVTEGKRALISRGYLVRKFGSPAPGIRPTWAYYPALPDLKGRANTSPPSSPATSDTRADSLPSPRANTSPPGRADIPPSSRADSSPPIQEPIPKSILEGSIPNDERTSFDPANLWFSEGDDSERLSVPETKEVPRECCECGRPGVIIEDRNAYCLRHIPVPF
jgi:hypothetical protein